MSFTQSDQENHDDRDNEPHFATVKERQIN